MSEKLKQSVDTSHGVALPPGCEVVRRPEGRYLRMPKWLLVSLSSIGLAMLLASCMTPGNTPEPSVLDTIPSPEPTLVEGEETEPEEEMVEIPLPAATETAEATVEPTAEPSPEPTPTVDMAAAATREAILSVRGMTSEILEEMPWVENVAGILGDPSSFAVRETDEGYYLEVVRAFEATSSYNLSDVLVAAENERGYEIFNKRGTIGYDENNEAQVESIPLDYTFVMTLSSTGEATATYIPEQTTVAWVQESGDGLFIGDQQADGVVRFIDHNLYFQQLDLEAAQAVFPGVVRIERFEDGTAIGYDLDGNPIAQEVEDGEWQAYEPPEPVREWAYGPDEWVNTLEGQPMPSAEHTLVHNFDSWEIGTIPSDLTLFTPDQFAAALKRDGIINPEVALFKFQGPEAPQYGEITRVVPGFAVGYGVGEAIVGPPSNRRTNEVHYLLMQTFFIDDEGNLVTFVYPQRMFTVRGDGAYTPSTAHTFSEVGEDGLPIFTALATGTPSLPGYPGGVEGLFNELTTESIASTGEPTLLYLFSKYGMVTATEIAPMEAALDNSQGVDIDALLNTMPVFRPSWGSLGYGFLKEDN